MDEIDEARRGAGEDLIDHRYKTTSRRAGSLQAGPAGASPWRAACLHRPLAKGRQAASRDLFDHRLTLVELQVFDLCRVRRSAPRMSGSSRCPRWPGRNAAGGRARARGTVSCPPSAATSRWIRCACSRIFTSLRIACMVWTASISMFGAQMTIRARCAFCTSRRNARPNPHRSLPTARTGSRCPASLRQEIALGHGVDMAADIDPYAPRRVLLFLGARAMRNASKPSSGNLASITTPALVFGICNRQSGRLPFERVGWNE